MSVGIKILIGDWIEQLKTLPDQSVHCCVTSPPYWGLRDYGVPGQLGLEKTPEEYVAKVVAGFSEVRRVLRDDGMLWLNLGDSYAGGGQNSGSTPDDLTVKQRSNAGCRYELIAVPAGLKRKDLVGIPWRVAFALQADGWYLRSDIIWHKPNPMPESVTDRPTKSHEYIFLLTKREKYYYDAEAIKERSEETSGWAKQRANGVNTWEYNNTDDRIAATGQKTEGSTLGTVGTRNKRSVWTVATSPYKGAHFATFPPDLIRPCVLAGCPVNGTVLDPFLGSGTTGQVALDLGRNCIGIELNPEYVAIAKERSRVTPDLDFT